MKFKRCIVSITCRGRNRLLLKMLVMSVPNQDMVMPLSDIPERNILNILEGLAIGYENMMHHASDNQHEPNIYK